MNCNPGDVCIIKKSAMGNEGKILTVLKFIGNLGEHPLPGWTWGGDDWRETDFIHLSPSGVSHCYCKDSYLQPLRGDLLKDEEVTEKELEKV